MISKPLVESFILSFSSMFFVCTFEGRAGAASEPSSASPGCWRAGREVARERARRRGRRREEREVREVREGSIVGVREWGKGKR